MYPSCSESLSFVWDETKHIFERKLLIEAPIIFLRCLHFFFDTLLLFVRSSICHSLIWWNGFSRRHFLYMFSKNITIFKVNCIYFFSWLNPWPWEIVKFEKNWGQICYCVLTPSIATSSFLTAWKLVFFPGGPGPNFHMVQAFYGVSLLCVPPRSGKLLKSAIWVGIAKDYTLAVLFCCEKSG